MMMNLSIPFLKPNKKIRSRHITRQTKETLDLLTIFEEKEKKRFESSSEKKRDHGRNTFTRACVRTRSVTADTPASHL
jgi:hypothetical protein